MIRSTTLAAAAILATVLVPTLRATQPEAIITDLAAASSRPAESELEQYPGFRRLRWEEDEVQYDREERARENLTVECMRERGRTYVSAPSRRYNAGEDATEQAVPTNANDRYVSSLSGGDRQAYFMDLYGVPDPFDESTQPTSSTSCVGRAHSTVPGLYVLSRGLLEERRLLPEVAAAGAGGQEAFQAWSRCMKDSGHEYAEPAVLHRRLDDAAKRPNGLKDNAAGPAMIRHETVCKPQLDRRMSAEMVTLEAAFVKKHAVALADHKAKLARYEAVVARYQQ